MNPYVAKAREYALAVVSGEIYSCKWVRLACKRQLDDIERQNDPAWPFRFDEAIAGRACEFLEQLPYTQGPFAFVRDDGSWNTLVLQPWQCFITCAVYGWIRRDSSERRPVRRFTRVYEEEPRSNGKSLRLSGALLYSFAEGEQGVEAYSAAVNREQASKVYGEAIAMLTKRPDLAQALGLEVSAHALFQKATNSRATALSRDAKKSGDGKNVAFAALDELHAHQTREVYEVIDSGTGKRGGNALVWVITTAGFDPAGVCYDKRDYVTKILEGTISDDAWFGIIYTLDDPDKWADEECRAACSDHSYAKCEWRAANPNWGVSVDPVDFVETKMRRALQSVSDRNGILTKHLDIWCSADASWMDLAKYDACADPTLKKEDFKGEPCIIGLDLASKVDLVAKVDVFFRDFDHGEKEDDGTPKLERHFYAFTTLWLPEAAIADSKNAQYKAWAEKGLIQSMPGATIDDDPIRDEVMADAATHAVGEIAYDPWGARQLANVLSAKGQTMVELKPTVANFSEPMKSWEALVLEGRFHHDGNPAVRWQVSNVICHRDRKDNIYPAKLKTENKIDAAVATIMALNRALLAPEAPADPYATRGYLSM